MSSSFFGEKWWFTERVKTISIVVPFFNEADSIRKVLEQVIAANTSGLAKEVILVDDASTDGSLEVAEDVLRNLPPGVSSKVIKQTKNSGKSRAVVKGIEQSTGDFLIIQDADLEYDPADFVDLLVPVVSGRADVVMGSRFKGGKPHRVVYFLNEVGNRVMSSLLSVVSGLRLTDIHCCYMILPGPVIRASVPIIRSDRWGFNPEICSLIADWREDLRVVEVGISYYGRSRKEGKKIRFHHGVIALGEILRFNLRPARPFPAPNYVNPFSS